MTRFKAGHVPDLCRPADGLQRCSCGFLAATLDQVREHAWGPQPEPVWTPPVPVAQLPEPVLRRRCAAMAGGYEVFPVHRCGRLAMHDSDCCWQHTTTHRRMAA